MFWLQTFLRRLSSVKLSFSYTEVGWSFVTDFTEWEAIKKKTCWRGTGSNIFIHLVTCPLDLYCWWNQMITGVSSCQMWKCFHTLESCFTVLMSPMYLTHAQQKVFEKWMQAPVCFCCSMVIHKKKKYPITPHGFSK